MLEWASTKISKNVKFESSLCELKYQKDLGTPLLLTHRRYVQFWKRAGVQSVLMMMIMMMMVMMVMMMMMMMTIIDAVYRPSIIKDCMYHRLCSGDQ